MNEKDILRELCSDMTLDQRAKILEQLSAQVGWEQKIEESIGRHERVLSMFGEGRRSNPTASKYIEQLQAVGVASLIVRIAADKAKLVELRAVTRIIHGYIDEPPVVDCDQCDGAGSWEVRCAGGGTLMQDCDTCDGTGKVRA